MWTKIDLRKGEKTLPPADKKVLLYVDGDYHAGYITGRTILDTKRNYALWDNTIVSLKKHKVWWQNLPQPPI